MYDYQHGGNAVFEIGNQDILDLSANINPLGFPLSVGEAIKNQIPLITRYPDSLSRELREAIAGFEQVKPDWVFCGNGASDIIFRIPVCMKPKTALLYAPSFLDYERSLKVSGTEVKYHFLKEEKGFHLDNSFIKEIESSNADIVFICNPNNPTGIITERTLIEEVLLSCERINAIAVIDECFIDFVENASNYTAKPLLKKFKNLIILKAFTKIFALAGIRLGYALCGNSSIINRLYESGPDWAVSNIAQSAGIAALNEAMHSTYLPETVSFVTSERNLLKYQLEEMNYITFDSKANYVFFKNPHGFDLFEKLREFNIIIRNCGNYAGLSKDFCRAAVSSKENNKKFMEALKHLWILRK